MSIRALIFDLDGTLVDNMQFHADAWAEWHGRHGLAFDRPDFFRHTTGRANAEIFAQLCPHATAAELDVFAEEKEAIYRELYAPHRRPHIGLAALLEAAKRDGLPLAVATSAPQINIDFTLNGIGLASRFAAVVNPRDGIRAKPHPDLFLEAARQLEVAPNDCLVFEDAPLGVEAARRAGMRCVAITTTLSADIFSGCDNVLAAVPDFSAFTITGGRLALA